MYRLRDCNCRLPFSGSCISALYALYVRKRSAMLWTDASQKLKLLPVAVPLSAEVDVLISLRPVGTEHENREAQFC